MKIFDIIFLILSAIVIILGILLILGKTKYIKSLERDDIVDLKGYSRRIGIALLIMGTVALLYSVLTNIILNATFVMVCSISLIIGFFFAIFLIITAKNKYS